MELLLFGKGAVLLDVVEILSFIVLVWGRGGGGVELVGKFTKRVANRAAISRVCVNLFFMMIVAHNRDTFCDENVGLAPPNQLDHTYSYRCSSED